MRCWRLENRRGWYIMDANVYNNPIFLFDLFSCAIWYNIQYFLSTSYIKNYLMTYPYYFIHTVRLFFHSIFYFFLFGWGPYNKGFLNTHGYIHGNPMSMAKEIPITKLMLFEINVFPDLVYQFEFGTPIWKMDFLNNKLKLLLILLLKSLQTYLTITRIYVT